MDSASFDRLVAALNKIRVQIRTDLTFAELTTLGVGGTIKLVVYPDSVSRLLRAVKLLQTHGVRYVVLGRGSNVLASDAAFDGAVISTVRLNKVRIGKNAAFAQAGVSAVTFAKLLRDKGLSGGEFFACLPASVGGAVVCNAGCYNQDVKSVLKEVTVLHNGRLRKLTADKCGLGKRTSLFKNNPDYVVLSARFAFTQSTPQAVDERIVDFRSKKAASQPLNYRSAGCMFYHDRVAVSRLIDEAGLKGLQIGGAKISTKHAGFVVNVDKAESKDIYLLIRRVRDILYAKYGVTAKVEACPVNFTKDEQDDLFSGS